MATSWWTDLMSSIEDAPSTPKTWINTSQCQMFKENVSTCPIFLWLSVSNILSWFPICFPDVFYMLPQLFPISFPYPKSFPNFFHCVLIIFHDFPKLFHGFSQCFHEFSHGFPMGFPRRWCGTRVPRPRRLSAPSPRLQASARIKLSVEMVKMWRLGALKFMVDWYKYIYIIICRCKL